MPLVDLGPVKKKDKLIDLGPAPTPIMEAIKEVEPAAKGFDPNKPIPFFEDPIPPTRISEIADPQDVSLQAAPVKKPKVVRSRWDEFVDATGRGIARVGSAGAQAAAAIRGMPQPPGAWAPPEAPERIKIRKESAAKLRKGGDFLWKLSQNPGIAAQNKDLASKALNLIGETIPYITATTAAYVTTGPVGGFTVGSLVEGNSAYRTALDAKVPEAKAKQIGIGVGVISGAVEAFGGRYAEQLALKAVSKLKNKVLKAGAVFGIGTVVEALEEGAQEIAAITGEETYRDVDWNERATRVLSSMAGGGFLGGTMRGGSMTARGVISTAEKVAPTKRPTEITPDARVADVAKKFGISEERARIILEKQAARKKAKTPPTVGKLAPQKPVAPITPKKPTELPSAVKGKITPITEPEIGVKKGEVTEQPPIEAKAEPTKVEADELAERIIEGSPHLFRADMTAIEIEQALEIIEKKPPVGLKAEGLTREEIRIVGSQIAKKMRERQKLRAKVGYKRGQMDSLRVARENMQKFRMAEQLKQQQREDAAEIVRTYVPKEKQYRYTKRILAAKTPKRIEQLSEAIDTYIDREDKRLAVKDFRNFVKGVNKKYRRGETKLGKLRKDTKKAIAEVLNKFDIVKLSEAKEKDLRSLEGYVRRISGTVANAFESMEEEATDIMQMPNARIKELERLGKVHIGELDADQIRYIQKSLEDLIAVSERKGQIKQAMRAEKLRDKVNASIKEIAPRKAVEPTEMLGAVKWVAVHGQSNLDTLSGLATGKNNATTKSLLDTGLHKGNKKKAGKLKEFVLYSREKLKGINFTVKDLTNLEKLEKITIGGKTFYAHREQIVALYAHTQAEGNLRRLLKTQGLNFTVYKRHPKYGFLKARQTIRTGKPTLSEIKQIISKVTDKEKALVEKHFEINREKQVPAINETSMAMQNFPIARHKKHFHVSREIERGVEGITPEISIAIDQQGRYLPRTGGTNRINIVPFTREFMNALQSDATYYGMSEALQDSRTLLSNRKYRQRMKDAGQGRALKEMTTMLRRIQGLPADRMMIELAAAKGLSNIGKSILSLRVSGGGVQICSVPAAWGTIEPKYFVGNVPTTPARIERLKKLSPVLWLRWEARQFDFVMGSVHAQHAFRTLLLESTPITDKMLKQYTWGDMVAIDQIDQAAQRKIATETKLKRGTKEFDQKAIELTELATRKSQPIWDLLGRSPLTSAPNVILRGSLMFMSARNAQYNVALRAIDDMRKGRIGKAEGAKRLAGIGTANMLISLWRRLFKILMKFGIAGLVVFLGKEPEKELGPTLKKEAVKEIKKIPFEVPMNIIGLAAFGAIFTNIAYRAMGRIKYGRYPRPIGETRTGNVFADIILDFYQLSDHLLDTAQYKITGARFKSGPDKGNLKWKRSAKKAADVLAELIAYRFGWPYTGPKGDVVWPAKAVTKEEPSIKRKTRLEREKRMLRK